MIVTEYMENGSMDTFLRVSKVYISLAKLFLTNLWLWKIYFIFFFWTILHINFFVAE